MAGPCRPIGRRPRHGALGVREAICRPAHRCVARDRNPCRGSAFNSRSAAPAARSRLVHGNVSGVHRAPGNLPGGRACAGNLSRQALRPDSLTRGSRGIECGALVPGPSRRAGSAAGNSRLSRHRTRHRMLALADRRHRRLRQRPRVGAPCARPRGAESLDGGSWFPVHKARARARKIVVCADPGRW